MLKKYSKQIIIFLLLIEAFTVFLTVKSYTNKDIDKIKEVSKIDRKMFTMYVEQDDGTYKEETDTNYFPSIGYRINEEKTYCVDHYGEEIDQAITFKDGSITVTGNKTVFCTLYFKKKGDDITVTVSTSGTTGVVPTSSGYKASLTCDTAESSFNEKYQRIEISSISGDETNCNLDYTETDTSSYTTLLSEAESKATLVSLTNSAGTSETSYRYTGKEPDNWVWFNNEMWRIIGSVPTCLDEDCSTKENLIKIIRSQPIGGLVFNTEKSNSDWGSNSLYTLLNSYYYGRKNITGNNPCYGFSDGAYMLCNYTKIGISDKTNNYYGKMIKSVYWNIGTVSSTATTISNTYTLETATISSVSGKVGLMNASDYGYASGQKSRYLSNLDNYEQNNWLYGQDSEWTITTYSTSKVIYFYFGGNGSDCSVSGGNSVRPVIYLEPTVYIIDGSGTIDDPYIIGM